MTGGSGAGQARPSYLRRCLLPEHNSYMPVEEIVPVTGFPS